VTVTIGYYSLDIAGNYETIRTFVVPAQDTAAPMTTALLHPTGHNGWHASPVSVTLVATDTLSGVDATLYRLNNGSWQMYLNPFVISADGNHQLDFYSLDNAGNVEVLQTVAIRVDRVLPESAVTSIPPQVIDSLIPISWTAADAGSGIDEVRLWYQFGQHGIWTMSTLSQSGNNGIFQFLAGHGQGTYCFTTQAVDVVGNTESAPEGPGTNCVAYMQEIDYTIYLPVVLTGPVAKH
jgi:hypothetical protein